MTFVLEHAGAFGTMLGCLLASAFFSGSETAMFTLSASQRQQFRASSRGIERRVAQLMHRPRSLLNTLLLGNMLVNIAFSAIAAVLAIQLDSANQPAWVVGVASVAPLLVVLLLGEVTPKMLAYSTARRWAVWAAGPVEVLRWLFLPVLWVLDRGLVEPCSRLILPSSARQGEITVEELQNLLTLSARRGVLDHDTGEMLHEIVELTDVTAGEIMVPRVDMIAYDLSKGSAGLIELFRRTGLRKLPVYRGDPDHILGVIHAKRLLLKPDTPIAELLRPVSFLPEAASLDKVLTQFRTTRRQMAIVVDEYGGTAGLITLQDVLEEIVGDLSDRHDAPSAPPVRRIGPTQYVVSGDLSVRDWAEAFDLAEPIEGRISTLGGLVTSLLGRIPHVGDTATYRNLRFTVRAMRRRRVESLDVEWIGGEA